MVNNGFYNIKRFFYPVLSQRERQENIGNAIFKNEQLRGIRDNCQRILLQQNIMVSKHFMVIKPQIRPGCGTKKKLSENL